MPANLDSVLEAEWGFRPACEMRHQTLDPWTTSSGGDILRSALVVYKKKSRFGKRNGANFFWNSLQKMIVSAILIFAGNCNAKGSPSSFIFLQRGALFSLSSLHKREVMSR